jgi:uncharacterized membrane protein YozB (DUF420 family)
MLVGAYFYAYPVLASGYWPWPVKGLAARFLGAIFLAITFGCWSTLRSDLWQRGKILVLVGAVFYSLIGTVSVAEAISLNTVNVWLWTVYFLGASIGLFLVLGKYGWYMTRGDFLDEPGASRTSQRFFRIQTVIVGVFGSILFFLPSIGQAQFWPWKVAFLPTLQVFGALFLSTCLATGWASIQKDKGRLRILLPLDASFPALALLAVFLDWNTVVVESPSWLVTLVWIGLYLFVAVGSTILYWKIRVRWK